MLNKKGDMAIVLLVFLVLIVSAAALFSFATSGNRIGVSIEDSDILDKIYLKENLAEFYLKQLSERVLVKTYSAFVEGDAYFLGDIGINENFEMEFKENFENELARDNSEEFIEEVHIVLKDYNLNEDIFEVSFEKINLSETSKGVGVQYILEIDFEISLELEGMHSFEKIKTAKEKCVKEPNVFDCFNSDLNNFKAEGTGDLGVIHFESKKYFLVDGNIRKIEFEFIPN